jgi:hypothetical protein
MTNLGMSRMTRASVSKKQAQALPDGCNRDYVQAIQELSTLLRHLSGRIWPVNCTFFEAISALISQAETYANTLTTLTGNAFQAEICARLQSVVLGFQTIPSKPHGDAGLDGFSHSGTQGYCCYGPELKTYRQTRTLEKAVIEKFKSDLRRLLELEFKKKVLTCCENVEMGSILPSSKKLIHVDLVVNWFESHRVVGPIHSAFLEYKAVSKLRYVDTDATVAIIGPTELANRWSVDELTLVRAQQKSFYQVVQEAAKTLVISDPKTFDEKMALLKDIRPDQLQAIDKLVEQFLFKWRLALAFDIKLNETMPNLHQILEASRSRIVTRIAELMLASSTPWTELGKAGEIARAALDADFGSTYGSMMEDIAAGEVARLIGECSIGWVRPGAANAN